MMGSLHGDFTTNIVCSTLAIFILALRLGSTIRVQSVYLSLDNILVALSIIVATTRAVCNGVYDVLGTATMAFELYHTLDLTPSQLSRLKSGTILDLCARILVTTFYWLQISLLLLFYSRLLKDLHYGWKVLIRCTWVLLGLTYVATVLATTLECHPFHLYWQVNPPPGRCIKAYIQLYTQGCSNIVLDSLVLSISWPILRLQHRSNWQKIRITAIYCLGFLCITITAVRVALTKDSHSSAITRSIWASVQVLVYAAVANLPTTYGNLQVMGRKRKKSSSQEVTTVRTRSQGNLYDFPEDKAMEIRRPSCPPEYMEAGITRTRSGIIDFYDAILEGLPTEARHVT